MRAATKCYHRNCRRDARNAILMSFSSCWRLRHKAQLATEKKYKSNKWLAAEPLKHPL